MVNPSVIQQLAKAREREIFEATRKPRVFVPQRARVRERLGWSLVGLGVHLALNSRDLGASYWKHGGRYVPVREVRGASN